MNFLALDLEMNQPSGKIIQIGAVVANVESGKILEQLSIYINPHEQLSQFIIDLTGITQKDVDSGAELVGAYQALKDLHEKYRCHTNAIVWGGGDSQELANQLNQELNGNWGTIRWCFGRRWIDVKTIIQSYALLNGLKPQQGGLAKVLTKFGMKFEGRKHNAVADAKNTALLFLRLKDMIHLPLKT